MITQVIISAAGLGLASLLGSVAGLVVKRVSHKWNDVFLGFCAGMMLAASIAGLIMPALAAVDAGGLWQVFVGVMAGVLLIAALDRFVPHLHGLAGLDRTGSAGGRSSLDKVLLFVLAIAIHKFPEGIAAGVVFDDSADLSNAYAVSVAIALQNIPEGMVVVTPLLMAGVSYVRTVVIALTIAMLEMTGVGAGYLLGELSGAFLPGFLGLAGGAMLYVISGEMIPEPHSHGYEKPATNALVAGVLAMLLIQEMA